MQTGFRTDQADLDTFRMLLVRAQADSFSLCAQLVV